MDVEQVERFLPSGLPVRTYIALGRMTHELIGIGNRPCGLRGVTPITGGTCKFTRLRRDRASRRKKQPASTMPHNVKSSPQITHSTS